MLNFSCPQQFENAASAFKELQCAGFKLWRWTKPAECVWWSPGRQRVLMEKLPDGSVRTASLTQVDSIQGP